MSDQSAEPNPGRDLDIDNLYRIQVREHQNFAMFLIDRDGRATTWNRGVQHIFGYSEQEWVGRDAKVIFSEEDRAAGVPEHEFGSAAAHGRATDIRWHLRKDGTRVFISGVLEAVRNDNGDLVAYSKICLDDTPRKRLEDALTQSNTDLQQFAWIASHDLQEPLRTISTYAELLNRRQSSPLDAESQQLLKSITEAAQRMSVLIHDLLA
jgi:PAS domain S-box-containing protein